MKTKITLLYALTSLIALTCFSQKKPTNIWSIGKADHSSSEFALAPNGFRSFVGKDFGYEDKYFLVGYSKEKKDFPYVIPGPADTWGGTWSTSGWRTSEVNILFGVRSLPADGEYKLVIKLLDYAKKFLPLLKISINGHDQNIQLGEGKFDFRGSNFQSFELNPIHNQKVREANNLHRILPPGKQICLFALFPGD